MTDGTFKESLWCSVTSLAYDFNLRRGVLYVPPRNCTSMRGCINLFLAIDPDVRMIKVTAGTGGTRYDSLYIREGGGEWKARFLDTATARQEDDHGEG